MSIFSRKSSKLDSAKRADKKAEKKNKKDSKSGKQQAAESAPPSGVNTPARSRAGSFAGDASSMNGRRNANGSPYSTAPRTSTGSQHNGRPDGVPRLPPALLQKYSYQSAKGSAPQSDGKHTTMQAPSFDSPILGNPKMQQAARDRGYVNPHHSADSGYASTGPASRAQSRAPSERAPEMPNNGLLRADNGFLNNLSFSEEIMREPAFSEHSYNDDKDEKAIDSPLSRTGQQDMLDSSSSTYDDQVEAEPKSLRSSPKLKTTKHARFEDTEPSPITQQRQYARPSAATIETQNQEPYQQKASSTVPPPTSSRSPQPVRTQDFTAPAQISSPVPQRHAQPPLRDFVAAVEPTSSAPDNNARSSAYASAPQQTQQLPQQTSQFPQQTQQLPQLERVISESTRGKRDSTPPLNILEGLKVNKRGKILDEEGDVIGELVEGDLIDCVRQRANAHGDVLDEYGGVVGRVKTLVRGSVAGSVTSYRSSQVPISPQMSGLYQHIGNYPQMASMQPIFSAVSQPGYQQQAFHQNVYQPIEMPPPAPQPQYSTLPSLPSVNPLDLPSNAPIMELDASEAVQSAPVEEEPIFDLSEPFMPPPSVPARSPKRSESPPVLPSQPKDSAVELQNTFVSSADVSKTSAESTRSTSEPQYLSAIKQNFSRPSMAKAQGETPVDTPSASAIEAQEPEQMKSAVPEIVHPEQPAQEQTNTTKTLQQIMALPRPQAHSTPSYQRPAMSPVPEGSPLKEDQPDSPALFSYKGDIPASDGPVPNARLAPPRPVGSKAPALPRQAFTGPSLLNVNSGPSSSTANRRLTANGLPTAPMGGLPLRPGMSSRYSTNTPLVRSPLASHETTPHESDESSNGAKSDDGKPVQILNRPMQRSRANSAATMRSMASTNKPRTYFTHGGRVTVAPEELPPPTMPADLYPPPQPAPGTEKKQEKRKRFSMFGSKKGGQAVSAH